MKIKQLKFVFVQQVLCFQTEQQNKALVLISKCPLLSFQTEQQSKALLAQIKCPLLCFQTNIDNIPTLLKSIPLYPYDAPFSRCRANIVFSDLAFGRTAYQSSTATDFPASKGVASKAVDGDTTTTQAGNSCTHTGQ